jgi:V8-like Glu-specific endopeptidase
MSARATPVRADPLVGAVFLGASDLHTCTGSVLHSRTGNLILTAAHCLASNDSATFSPGFSGRADPAATWTVDTIYLDSRWLAAQDPVADFAIARVSREDGRSLESAAGKGLTLGAAPSPGTVVRVTGYPLSVGGEPIGCRAATATASRGFLSLQCAGLSDGTSGAPWRTDSSVVGLTGGLNGGGCDETVSYSPPFDRRIVDLLRRAEAGGPGDTAPEAPANGC